MMHAGRRGALSATLTLRTSWPLGALFTSGFTFSALGAQVADFAPKFGAETARHHGNGKMDRNVIVNSPTNTSGFLYDIEQVTNILTDY